jgi:hypothetical protein
MKKWLIWIGASLAVLLAALAIAAWRLSREIEPFVKTKTSEYLHNKFGSEAEIGSLSAEVPIWELLRGQKKEVKVHGDGIVIRVNGRRDIPPLLALKRFSFEVDLLTLWAGEPKVRRVRLQGMEITMPPKGERPPVKLGGGSPSPEPPKPRVLIDEIIADGSKLTIWPKDPTKQPLEFELRKLKLESAGPGVPMKFTTTMTNAKPPGLIESQGTFGPWDTETPSATPATGDYRFHGADLGVFKGIAGTLESEGSYKGPLNVLTVDGWARVPDFRLSQVGQAVPLSTKFHAIVDGTNGNTLLQPVEATLGTTVFTCRGGVVRNKEEIGKTVALDVTLVRGNIADLLRLAMKGDKPFLRGGVALKMKFTLPPGKGPIESRLNIAGTFALKDARFTNATIQDKLDDLSQRSQGQPGNEEIDEVPTNLGGAFALKAGVMDFPKLQFAIPGAQVDLKGRYTFEGEQLDFRGTARTEARLSQMMKTRWKRWVLKPVDPFFAKDGAGTRIAIRIGGTRANPEFGRDREKN